MNTIIILLLTTTCCRKICLASYSEGFDSDFIEEVTALPEIKTVSTSFKVPEEKWTANALKDIAYYLRNYKFNEWDRRYFKERPNKTGYYDAFPLPVLKTLHWRVYDNCVNDFYECIVYLHSVIASSPFTRNPGTANVWHLDDNDGSEYYKLYESQSGNVCKKGLLSSEKSSLPFDDIIEKFQWRTSASYYMCWYTMLEIPELSMITEACDNFATCVEPAGFHNYDIRADDRQSFACAMYSFCPDPCCPVRLLLDKKQCHVKACPCFTENMDADLNKDCKLYRKNNQNFKDIIANRFNVSCHCTEQGFEWNSEYGLCIDIDECFTGKHNCDEMSQNCMNAVGSFVCVCKFGFELDETTGKCVLSELIVDADSYVFYNNGNRL